MSSITQIKSILYTSIWLILFSSIIQSNFILINLLMNNKIIVRFRFNFFFDNINNLMKY